MLCHHDWEQVLQWRPLADDVRLVDSTRLRRIKEGPERRAATLAAEGVDAVNMHANDWTGGLTTLFHRFDRLCLGWDAQHDSVLHALLAMGIDGVYSDHVDRMTEALRHAAMICPLLRRGPDHTLVGPRGAGSAHKVTAKRAEEEQLIKDGIDGGENRTKARPTMRSRRGAD